MVVEDGPSAARDGLAELTPPASVNVRIIENAREGRSSAANRGLREATGEFCGFFDDDDELFSNHATTLVGLLEKWPQSGAAYAASIQASRVAERVDAEMAREEVFFTPMANTAVLLRFNPFPIQAVVFRRSVRFHQQFDTNLDALEDWLFWNELLLEQKLVWTPEITSRFYVPADPIINASRLDSHRAAEPAFQLQLQSFLAERGIYNYGEIMRHSDAKLAQQIVKAESIHAIPRCV